MKPTLKKPSGKRTGQSIPAFLQAVRAFKNDVNVAEEQDEDETYAGSEDDSEDVKPPGGLTRSSSVGPFECAEWLANAISPRLLLPSLLSSQKRRNRKETSVPVCATSLKRLA